MARKIEHEDIKVGDTIEIKSTITVLDDQNNGLLGYDLEEGQRAYLRLLPGDTVRLIDRPIPPLPTKIGSVIEIDGMRWFLRESTWWEGGAWYSTEVSSGWDSDDIFNLAKKAGGFEVLL